MAKAKTSWSRGLSVPLYVKTGDDSAFWFSPDAEVLSAAEGILSGSESGLFAVVFNKTKLDEYRAKYRLSFEIFASFTTGSMLPNVFECLQGFDICNFSLKIFHDHIKTIDKTELPGILLDIPVNGLDDLTCKDREIFSNYLGAATYLAHAGDLVDCIFSLAEELRTDAFYEMLDKYKSKIDEALADTVNELDASSPLEYSDKLLRKNMRRRGPYDFYAFAPTVFSRYRAVRYIGAEQFMFFTVQDAVYDNEQTLRKLKSLADDTRFRIVSLLKEKGGLGGSEIVDATGLSASTVSHHMKNLREAGLVHEETDGTAKYYSLPTDITQSLVDALKEFLP